MQQTNIKEIKRNIRAGMTGWENGFTRNCARDRISLIWFYGISTIVGYLMPSPVFTHILNI